MRGDDCAASGVGHATGLDAAEARLLCSRPMRLDALNSLAMVAAVLVLAVGGPWLFGQLKGLQSPGELAARSGERIVTLEVAGMTCGGCASRVHGELASLDGVSKVEVRLGQDRAYVVCSPTLSDSLLVAAVGRAGPNFLSRVVTR